MQSKLLAFLTLVLSASALALPQPASTSTSGAALGNLGGAAPPVTNSGDPKRPFEVNGNTFVNESAAQQRSCDIQNNACFNAFNAGGASFTEADCTAQQQACNAAAPSTSGSGASSGSGSASASTSAAAPAAAATSAAAGEDSGACAATN